MSLQDIERIRHQFEKIDGAKTWKETSMFVASVLLSMVPVVGGAMSLTNERAKEALFGSDLTGAISSLAAHIVQLEPKLEQVSELSEKVVLLQKAVAENEQSRKLFDAAAEALASRVLNETELKNIGGIQRIADSVFEELRLVEYVAEGGRTLLERVEQSGSSKLEVGPGGVMDIKGSKFTSSGPQHSTTAAFKDAQIRPGAKVELPASGSGVRVTVANTKPSKGINPYSNESDFSAGIVISPGEITFGGPRKR